MSPDTVSTRLARAEEQIDAMKLQRQEDLERHRRERAEDRVLMLKTNEMVTKINNQLEATKMAGRWMLGLSVFIGSIIGWVVKQLLDA
jgi:hypothetical protein